MTQRTESSPCSIDGRSWLEQCEGDAPVLLIAPHGGRAEASSRDVLNPKVNDLHTADITREIARRMRAPAIINVAMDRNRLDLNRLSQLLAHAPWFVELVAERVGQMVKRHGRAVILLIHGWNVIQPRLDIGIGVRRHGAELRPSGSAHVSASESFINGPLGHLTERLRAHTIAATFGLRYPAGGAQNFLQAFTDRHAASDVSALRELSAMSSRGEIEAAQLELSVALRMPGRHRDGCIEALVDVFGNPDRPNAGATPPPLKLVRGHLFQSTRPANPARRQPATPPAPSVPPVPPRIGLECFDPYSRVGAMASFDLGPGGLGARVMMLLPDGRVALSTNEGKTRLDGSKAMLGPLELERSGNRLCLRFRGPVVMVPDASAYLRIEDALASGWLDESAEAEITLDPYSGDKDLEAMFDGSVDAGVGVFGTLEGRIRVDGIRCELGGFGRGGSSSTALGPHRFAARRLIWACFDKGAAPQAIEIRAHLDDGSPERLKARALGREGWSPCKAARVEIHTPSVSAPPVRLGAMLGEGGSEERMLVGQVENFVPLSRPGPANSRIFTSMGFASFALGQHRGAGLFEYSRRAERFPDGKSVAADVTDDD